MSSIANINTKSVRCGVTRGSAERDSSDRTASHGRPFCASNGERLNGPRAGRRRRRRERRRRCGEGGRGQQTQRKESGSHIKWTNKQKKIANECQKGFSGLSVGRESRCLLVQDPERDPASYLMCPSMRSPVRRPTVWSIVKFGNGMIAYVYYVAPSGEGFWEYTLREVYYGLGTSVQMEQLSPRRRRFKTVLPIYRCIACQSSWLIVEQCPVKL
jgi:hypothetical protein